MPFEVDVKAGETVKYEVSEELPRIDPFANTKQADWTGFATSPAHPYLARFEP